MGTLHLLSFFEHVLTDRDFAYFTFFTCEAHLIDLIRLRRLLQNLSFFFLARLFLLRKLLMITVVIGILVFFVYREHFGRRGLVRSKHWVPVFVRADSHVEAALAGVLRLLIRLLLLLL